MNQVLPYGVAILTNILCTIYAKHSAFSCLFSNAYEILNLQFRLLLTIIDLMYIDMGSEFF